MQFIFCSLSGQMFYRISPIRLSRLPFSQTISYITQQFQAQHCYSIACHSIPQQSIEYFSAYILLTILIKTFIKPFVPTQENVVADHKFPSFQIYFLHLSNFAFLVEIRKKASKKREKWEEKKTALKRGIRTVRWEQR